MTRRILTLVVGLAIYGWGGALLVRADLGLDPWTVLAQGVARHTGWGIGWVTNLLGAAILLLWIPLRQRPGVGTVANILLLGTSMQLALTLIPPVAEVGTRVVLLAAGILTVAVATGLYIGADFGPGPRDGLMTGLNARFGIPIWVARGGVELSVLAAGWLLGGTVGIGTVAFAALIGPLVHRTLPLLRMRPARAVSAAGTVASRRPA